MPPVKQVGWESLKPEQLCLSAILVICGIFGYIDDIFDTNKTCKAYFWSFLEHGFCIVSTL